MTLLEWLRKSNNAGEVAGWLQARHREALIAAAHHQHLRTVSAAEQQPAAAFRQAARQRWKLQRDGGASPGPFRDWLCAEALRLPGAQAENGRVCQRLPHGGRESGCRGHRLRAER